MSIALFLFSIYLTIRSLLWLHIKFVFFSSSVNNVIHSSVKFCWVYTIDHFGWYGLMNNINPNPETRDIFQLSCILFRVSFINVLEFLLWRSFTCSVILFLDIFVVLRIGLHSLFLYQVSLMYKKVLNFCIRFLSFIISLNSFLSILAGSIVFFHI